MSMNFGNMPNPNYNMNMNPYNNYNPYQTNIDRMNQQIQQMQQQLQPQQQIQPTNMEFIVVDSIESAKNYVVQNGQTLWFRHSMNPEIYVKTVSNIGEPNFMAYSLSPIISNNVVTETTTEDKNFVPIENFNALNNKVTNLENKLTMYEQLFNNVMQSKQQPIVDVELNDTKKVGRPKSNSTQKVGE